MESKSRIFIPYAIRVPRPLTCQYLNDVLYLLNANQPAESIISFYFVYKHFALQLRVLTIVYVIEIAHYLTQSQTHSLTHALVQQRTRLFPFVFNKSLNTNLFFFLFPNVRQLMQLGFEIEFSIFYIYFFWIFVFGFSPNECCSLIALYAYLLSCFCCCCPYKRNRSIRHNSIKYLHVYALLLVLTIYIWLLLLLRFFRSWFLSLFVLHTFCTLRAFTLRK